MLFVVLGGGTLFFPLFVFPKTFEVVNLPKTFFLFLLVGVLVLLWSIGAMLEKKLLVRRSMLDIPFVLFGVAVLVSSLFSVSVPVSFFGTTDNFTLTAFTIFPAVLFAYLIVQLIKNRTSFVNFIQIFFLSHIVAELLFYVFQIPFIRTHGLTAWFGHNFFNTVSTGNSIFGIWVAALGVLSFGTLLLKGRKKIYYILPAISAVLSLITLFRLGFTVSFVVFGIGLGMLLVLPFLFARSTSVKVSLALFSVFVLTLLCIGFGTPQSFKMHVPVEIALGAQSSFDFVKAALGADVKQFLVGSGPGTFLYDFSLHRTPAFNTNAIVFNTRFHAPFSTFLALLVEVGLLGSVFFILLILIGLGAMLSTWTELRSSWKGLIQERVATTLHAQGLSSFAEIFDVFVVGAAWIALTVGLCVSFVDIVSWWTWWCFLALIIVGIGFVNKKFVVEKDISLVVSPQYSLALSFGIILFFTLIILSTAFGVRMYLAEYSWVKASQVSSLDEAEAYLQRSIEYRRSYAPYQVSLARVYLQKAKVAYEKNNQNTPEVASLVASAANVAKIATELEPNNVENYETLALMYLNAHSFAPEANTWAKDALLSALLLEPSNVVNHTRLAQVYIQENKLSEAEKELQKAIELKFDYVPAYEALIVLYRDAGKYNEALGFYEVLLKITDPTGNLLFNYGVLFFNRHEKGDDDRAQKLWEQALRLDAEKKQPTNPNILYSLGLLFERKGDKSTALSYYQKVRELVPQNDDVKKKIQSMLR